MQLKILARDKASIELQLTDVDNTLIQPLLSILFADENVADVMLKTAHPLDKPRLYLKMKSGHPQTALKRAADKLKEQFEELQELYENAAKSFR